MTTWDKNRQRINGLWPEVTWTPMERELWTERLQVLDQTTLQSALEKVVIQYARQKPALKWVLCEYETMTQEEREREAHLQGRMDRVERMQAERDEVGRDRSEMQNVLRQIPPEDLKQLDPDKPLDEWSSFAVGITYAAHTCNTTRGT